MEKLTAILNNGYENNTQVIKELKEEISALREELTSKERDVLICENAKLKMKVKEKTFENIELKEKLKKAEEKQGGFLKKLFS